MGGVIWVIRPLAVLMLLLSLAFAPVTNALTHGPGTLAAEADHAAWRAEKGEVWQAEGHIDPFHHATAGFGAEENVFRRHVCRS